MATQTLARITYHQPTASGRRTGWARTFGAIDRTQRGAKAFVGEYLPVNQQIELPVGILIVEVSPCGSVKNGSNEAQIWRLEADGSWTRVGNEWNWHSEFLSLLDDAETALTENVPGPTREQLLAERAELQARLSEINSELDS